MGQPIVVNEKPSPNRGVVRFETNRAITGMGHERYAAGTEVWGERPPDVLARRLLARGGVLRVQINGNVVTVDLERGWDATGLKEIIENLYRFYPDQPDAPPAEPAATEPAATEPVEAEPAAGDPPAEPEPAGEPAVPEPPAGPAEDEDGGASLADPVVAEAPASDPEGAVAPSAPAAPDDTLGATGTVAGDAPEPGVDRTEDPPA